MHSYLIISLGFATGASLGLAGMTILKKGECMGGAAWCLLCTINASVTVILCIAEGVL